MTGARKASSKPAKSLEATLLDAADKLRGNLEASEYKHVVLGLVVFLKYVSDAFTARLLELETALADPDSDDHIPSEARRERILESRDEYTKQSCSQRTGSASLARRRMAGAVASVPGARPVSRSACG